MNNRTLETLECLQDIERLKNGLDLDELDRQSSSIVENLKTINDDSNDLDELDRQSSSIVGNLETIQRDESDLDELDRVTGRIAANLQQIAELLEREDVAEVVRQLRDGA